MSSEGLLRKVPLPVSNLIARTSSEAESLVQHGSAYPRLHASDSQGQQRCSSERWRPAFLSQVRLRHALLGLILLAGAVLGICALSSGSLFDGDEVYAKFLVVGDWGRLGQSNQTEVARVMAKKAALLKANFVISTGDNFYDSGLLGSDDPAFDTSFRDVYTAASLQIPWFAILGNRDYGSDSDCDPDSAGCTYSPLHQLSLELVKRDARWNLERSYQLTLGGGQAEIFFIDTTPYIEDYYSEPWAGFVGGIREQSWRSELAELETKLARSAASWKIVIGHHAIRSNRRRRYDLLADSLEPLLERYGVQAYFCGHDHDLQHINAEGSGVHYLVSGAGSLTTKGFLDDADSLFQYDGSGFVAVTLSRDELLCEFLGIEGNYLQPIHTARIPKLPPH
ncbi:hypothetical protein WJX72_005515 [[Myrmecia] bisecta]|uniref:Calcineurin-like phosphoesterase domain-containing protein n=1 Tax=[Myrmecia] bisecta TaxID=41462 RepID=A0AAW1PD41_9CHLO